MNLDQMHDLYYFNINTSHLLQQIPIEQTKIYFDLRKKSIKMRKTIR